MQTPEDESFMRVALFHAKTGWGRVAPNPSVGCVIVKKGVIVAAQRTADGGRPHAETRALAQAGHEAKGACVYVTLEPCAHRGQTGPCAQALVRAGVARVVVACQDPDPRVSGQGLAQLQAGGVVVVTGVLEREARQGNQGFFYTLTQQRPWVTAKLAVSSDGRIACATGERTQISGFLADQYKHRLRTSHDAILIGIETALADDPLLTARIVGHSHVMRRIVLDANLRIPMDSMLVKSVGYDPLWVFYKAGSPDKIKALHARGVRLFPIDPYDIRHLLSVLATEGVTRLLVEGGARIHSAFLAEGVVDSFVLLKSPVRLGAGAVPALPAQDIFALPAFSGLTLQKTRVLGEDLLEIYARPL